TFGILFLSVGNCVLRRETVFPVGTLHLPLVQEGVSDAHSRYETVSPSASTERCQPPPPARAAERGSAPQAVPHRRPRWLWDHHAPGPFRPRLGRLPCD